MQVFVEHPEVLVGSSYEPASTLIKTKVERSQEEEDALTIVCSSSGTSCYLARDLDEKERLFGVGASLGSFTLPLHQSRLHRQKPLVRRRGCILNNDPDHTTVVEQHDILFLTVSFHYKNIGT